MVFCDKALFVVRLIEFKGAITHHIFNHEDEALFYADAEFQTNKFCIVSVFKGPHPDQRQFLEEALVAGTIQFQQPIYQESYL